MLLLAHKFLAFLETVRLAFDVNNGAVMQDTVQDGGGNSDVGKDLVPLGEGLIRGFTDTGIVSIIDPRLRDKPAAPYHDITWASLPIHNRTTSINELREFYNALDAGLE